MNIEIEMTEKEFLEKISENAVAFQLHSDPQGAYHTAPLGKSRPPMSEILDTLARKIGRDLKYVYGYDSERWKISFADYVK